MSVYLILLKKSIILILENENMHVGLNNQLVSCTLTINKSHISWTTGVSCSLSSKVRI